jgi:hypothetical protein
MAVVARRGFQTARQLINAIENMALSASLDEIYVKDCEGNELGILALEQEVLSDGSVAFNLILESEGDPNS